MAHMMQTLGGGGKGGEVGEGTFNHNASVLFRNRNRDGYGTEDANTGVGWAEHLITMLTLFSVKETARWWGLQAVGWGWESWRGGGGGAELITTLTLSS